MLNIGDKNDKIEIIDADRLCYRVLSRSKGAEGIRTISKDIVAEFVESLKKNPNQNATELREKLTGTSQIDRFEYGYNSTIYALARIDLEKTDDESIPFYQKIFFGAPGTGKSYKVNQIAPEDDSVTFRTTFHPDYDYAQFVGSYKPVSVNTIDSGKLSKDQLAQLFEKFKNSTTGYPVHKFGALYWKSLQEMSGADKKAIIAGNQESTNTMDVELNKGAAVGSYLSSQFTEGSSISYSFVPQVFANAVKAAFDNPGKQIYLVIEEINRGNCAQIFGDIFQLLDRDENGVSRYSIDLDSDFAEWLGQKTLRLPPNFNILATMNTSDQSLFPMDSAFKRRFDWEYVPIKYAKDADCGDSWNADKFVIKLDDDTCYSWLDFLSAVNDDIYEVTQSEDKQMGEFFVKPKDNEIDQDMFLSKVMFYLWDSVYKDEADKKNVFHFDWTFANGKKSTVTFQSLFKNKNDAVKILKTVMENLKVETI